ncbi:MAG: dUTP diphosphatase [Alphaproteobacteria bacterium]|nr:dUTP diphosphatase [Alphaproteobacteria bacterium]
MLKIRLTDQAKTLYGDIAFDKDNSAIDLRAAIDRPMAVRPGQRVLVPTGMGCEICFDLPPFSFEWHVRPRSGLSSRGIDVKLGTGDEGFRGEIKVTLHNSTGEDFTINAGDRVAQLVLCPIIKPEITIVDQLSDTQRGDKSFGSSGI